MAFSGGHPGQVELAVIVIRGRYCLISPLLLSVVTGGTSFNLTRPGPSMMNTGSFGFVAGTSVPDLPGPAPGSGCVFETRGGTREEGGSAGASGLGLMRGSAPGVGDAGEDGAWS